MPDPNWTIAPDWYPDPADPRMMRWWNGLAWTANVLPRPDQYALETTAVANERRARGAHVRDVTVDLAPVLAPTAPRFRPRLREQLVAMPISA